MTQYLNVDNKLGIDKFNIDEGNPHITLNEDCHDERERDLLVRACPAGLYRYDDNGKFVFDYAGCLECGTCRIVSLGKIVKSWDWPMGTCGVMYRFG